MSKAQKRLDGMRANPGDDWSISDIRSVCEAMGVTCSPPKRGAHYKISHPSQETILTIPANRPVKAVYVRALVKFIECVLESEQ